MHKRLLSTGILSSTLAFLLVWSAFSGLPAAAQHHAHPTLALPDDPTDPHRKPSLPPSLTIPVAPLGFAAPAKNYLTSRIAQVSLDFLDEDHLLFTFRVPGLIAREQPAPGQSPEDERHIRALVLALPDGHVTAESIWTLHDYDPYVWKIHGNQFLLRDRNIVQVGDAQLHLTPYLRFPGPVNYLELDPDHRLLVVDTSEPPAVDPKSDPKLASNSVPASAPNLNCDQPNQSPASSTASHTSGPSADASSAKPTATARQNILRVMGLDSRTVMLFSRINGVVHLPVDGQGYYEVLRGKGQSWLISYQDFRGGTTQLTQIESACAPNVDVVATNLFLVTTCLASQDRRIVAMTRENHHLWETIQPATKVWPMTTRAADGRRIARSTLDISRPMGVSSPLDGDMIRSQTVQVLDLATGKVQLTASASPILDGGGNMALSPSGKRFALLSSGALQIFDLPPASAPPQPPHR